MKFNFKKISAIATSALMIGMTAGVAAAANYPAPFVVGGTADVAIVYGTGTGVSILDAVEAGNIQTNLQTYMGEAEDGGTTVEGGDSVLLAKASDNLNLGDTWSEVFTGTVTSDNLKTLLADGTYIADDNDEFDYEQKIAFGVAAAAPQFKHFRDSDYESLVGLTERTPTLGFKITSNTFILNYTLEFLEDVSSDVVSARMDDIEGSDLPLMGRTYYVSELNNDTTNNVYFGKMVLLDAANVGSVKEGETVTVSGHEVSIDWIDSDEVIFMVDGVRAPSSGKLQKGQSYKLNDGSYIGIRDISKLEVSGEIGSSSFSIGTGKLEFPSHGSDIKMNDDSVTGVKGYIYEATGNKLDKIVIEWKTDEEVFLTPETELLMPGFGALKFTMNDIVRSEEEKLVFEKDSDTSIRMKLPIKGGDATINLLYSNSSGEFIGIGKSATERLATTNSTNLTFYEKESGNDFHDYFFATYNISKEGESYLLRAKIGQDTTAARNETTIQSYENGAWVDVCDEKAASSTCDIGDVTLTIREINYTSGGNRTVILQAGTNVNFHSIITPGGLYVYLPFEFSYWNGWDVRDAGGNGAEVPGHVNFSNYTQPGHGADTVWQYLVGENKDEDLGVAAAAFNFTFDDVSATDASLQVSQVNHAGSGGGSTYGAEEKGDSTNIYEIYMNNSDTAPRVLHYTKPDEDYAEAYYPSEDSETYAEVFLTEPEGVITGGDTTGGTTQLGEVLVTDAEVSSVATKNLIVIGGSCINSAAATLVGGAYCGAAWTDATGVGSGQFLLKGYSDSTITTKLALLVAGYEKEDTVNAATYLRTQTVDTDKEYLGTSSTTAELVTTEGEGEGTTE